MRKLLAIVIAILLAALAPSSFALAQTATPAPTPTPDYRGLVPVGAVQMLLLADAADIPDGWLYAGGGCVAKIDYPQLYAVYGDTWGTPCDADTFKLPDMTGRLPIGTGYTTCCSGSLYTLGLTGGADSVTLTTTEMPAHSHGITDPGHQHPPLSPNTTFIGNRVGGGNTAPAGTGISTSSFTGSATTGIAVNSAGGGSPFSVMNPYFALDFYIWSGVTALQIASPAEDVVVTVVVVFPTHTPTPTLTPSMTPTDGPSPTPSPTATPTGQPAYLTSYTVGGQEVLMDYTVRPGDAFVGGMAFFIAGLMLIKMMLSAKRQKLGGE